MATNSETTEIREEKMAILGYQVTIAFIIIIASLFGKKSFYIAVGGAIIWTLTHVFMPWLMIVQFFTIFIAYSIGRGIQG